MTGYSTREVSEALGLSVSTILTWTRAGLLTPHRGPRGSYIFSFQDIALLRAARELLNDALPLRRVRQALEQLRDQLPAGRPLSAVQVSSLGDQILVHDSGVSWAPSTGQLEIDLTRPATPELRGPRPLEVDRAEPAPLGADEWYDRGIDLEAAATNDAMEAYRQALAADPLHCEAHLNLGRLLHEAGEFREAEEHYRSAAESPTTGARAHHNLGVVLEDQGRGAAAQVAYETAVRLDPELAAAHFNLSRLHESAGRQAEALQHLAAYRRTLDQR